MPPATAAAAGAGAAGAGLAGAAGASLAGAGFAGASLAGAGLAGASLAGAGLMGVGLTRAGLAGVAVAGGCGLGSGGGSGDGRCGSLGLERRLEAEEVAQVGLGLHKVGHLALVEEAGEVSLHFGAAAEAHAQRKQGPQVVLHQRVALLAVQTALPRLLGALVAALGRRGGVGEKKQAFVSEHEVVNRITEHKRELALVAS